MNEISKVTESKLKHISLNLNLNEIERAKLEYLYFNLEKYRREYVIDALEKRSQTRNWKDRWKLKSVLNDILIT